MEAVMERSLEQKIVIKFCVKLSKSAVDTFYFI